MKTFWRWMKFFLIQEPNLIKNYDYFCAVIFFRDDIKDAHRKQDWRRLCQYRAMFAIPLLGCIYILYLYRADLNEFDSYLLIDVLQWNHLTKLMYLCAFGFILLSGYLLNILYFSPDMDHFLEWQKRILVRGKPIRYHWPYHYKNQKCSDRIAKVFRLAIYGYQAGVALTGKFRDLEKKTNFA